MALGFIGGFGTTEIIIILVVGLVIFGGRLPEVGRSVAKSLLEFKKGLRDLKEETGLNEIQEIRDVGNELRNLDSAPDYAYRRGSLPGPEEDIADAAYADEEQRRAADEHGAADDPIADETYPSADAEEDARDGEADGADSPDEKEPERREG